jgi:DNA polymerase elongation subunit (family B)
MTKEEKIKFLENEIKKYQDLAEEQYNKEQSLKTSLNSMYGSIGNQYFTFFNIDIAEAVTQQAKEINLYAEKVLNHYINNLWYTDKETHEKLGIKIINKPLLKPAVVYMDTDSCYVSFETLLNSTNYKETKYKDNETQFILDLYEYRLKEYLEKAFDKFAKLRNTENYQKFELETIARTAIWLGKKKYFQEIAWDDTGTKYDKLEYIKSRGIEVIQSSTPSLIRKELKDILSFFIKNDKIEMKELVNWLKEIKTKFVNEKDFNLICKNIKVNNYDKYCIDDKNDFKYAFKCPINVRAAIYYNYLINKNNLKDKYPLINEGEKVKFYYCKDEMNEVFAYNPEKFPEDIAPEIDYDTMFYKVVIIPINAILEALKLPQLNEKLTYVKSLF